MTTPFLRNHIKPCSICGKGLMAENRVGLFWRIRAERLMIDHRAVQREHGLEQLLGGAGALAHIFSPESSFAIPFGEPLNLLVCEPCALTQVSSLTPVLYHET